MGFEMRSIRFKTALAAAGILAAAVAGVAYGQNKQVVFVAWGGTTQQGMESAWTPIFTKDTGAAVVSDGPTNYGKIKAMVDAKAVSWDVIDVEGDWKVRAEKDGLLEKIDYSGINVADVDKKYYSDYGPAGYAFSFVLAYNKNAVGNNVPQGWADFFDTKKFPGKRGMISWMTSGVIEMALLADGVKPENLYPLDVERAFKKFDTIKNDIEFWDSGAASQTQIATGETVMCFCWGPRIGPVKRDGAPVDIQWNQHLQTVDYLIVPKGSPNKDLAMKFLNAALTPEGQAKMAEANFNSPVNSKSKDLIDPAVWPQLSAAHPDQAVDINLDFWRDRGAELSERWAKWKVQ